MYNATRSLKEGKEKEKLLSRFSYPNNTSKCKVALILAFSANETNHVKTLVYR